MELPALALGVIGIVLMVFGLGAVSAWMWAVKSLRVPPPGWIIGVTAAAGTAMAGSFALQQDWLSALFMGFFFATVVGNQLQVGPFRRSGGGEAP